jgi:hypothetical protein
MAKDCKFNPPTNGKKGFHFVIENGRTRLLTRKDLKSLGDEAVVVKCDSDDGSRKARARAQAELDATLRDMGKPLWKGESLYLGVGAARLLVERTSLAKQRWGLLNRDDQDLTLWREGPLGGMFNKRGVSSDTGTLYNYLGYDQNGDHENGRDAEGYDARGFDPSGQHRDTGMPWGEDKITVEGGTMIKYIESLALKNILSAQEFEEDFSPEELDTRGFSKDGRHRDTNTTHNFQRFNAAGVHIDTGTELDPRGFNVDGVHSITGTNIAPDGLDANGFDVATGLHRGTGERFDQNFRDVKGADLTVEHALATLRRLEEEELAENGGYYNTDH